MKGILAVIAIVIIICALFVLVALGFISIPGLQTSTSADSYPDAEYCDYTELQILDMIELASGKDLNNQVGVSFVRSLNMEACGINDKSPTEIMSYYTGEYSDWYVYYDNSGSGSGYTVRIIIWTNDPSPSNSTLARSITVVDGVTVESAYGYDTIALVSDGTVVTYIALLAWINAS